MLIFRILFCTFAAIFGVKLKNSEIGELIIGGQPIPIEEVPYQAALYYRNYFFCAGSIVSDTHIVTAAHCLMYLPSNPTHLAIRVGTSKMHSGGELLQVKRFSIHPKFSRRKVDYDVGVIELKHRLRFGKGTRAIGLGNSEPEEGKEVRVSGWGFLRETGPASSTLQSVTVVMVARKTCAENYKKRLMITNRMICAWSLDKDACYGDSGGPLVHKGKLVGIVSTGEGCARKNFPGIYTSIANEDIKSFIEQETGL